MVFESHTVDDNLELALAGKRGSWPASSTGQARTSDSAICATGSPEPQPRPEAMAGDRHAARQDPKLLLVDEPAAGMTDEETADTARLLKRIAETHSVVVVEHDMAFVRGLDLKVTVLHEGAALAEGSLEHVSADPRVVEVYLGR